MTVATDPFAALLAIEAKALVEAVRFDDSGTNVGGQLVGGHGGLLSRATLAQADKLGLAVARYEGRPLTILDEIAAERRRQITEEGWTADHDDSHADGALEAAAASYAVGRLLWVSGAPAAIEPAHRLWQWGLSWFKPGSRRRNLVKAGALIVAAAERHERLSAGGGGG